MTKLTSDDLFDIFVRDANNRLEHIIHTVRVADPDSVEGIHDLVVCVGIEMATHARAGYRARSRHPAADSVVEEALYDNVCLRLELVIESVQSNLYEYLHGSGGGQAYEDLRTHLRTLADAAAPNEE